MERKGYSPEEQSMRDGAAKRIKEWRNIDRETDYGWGESEMHNSGILEYVESMQGLTHFLSYAKSLSFQKVKLLDIGAGYGRALQELSQDDDLNYNLDIIGTSLTKLEKGREYETENVRMVLTPAETLSIIGDGEVAAVISRYGLGHSHAPELVAKSLDRVLMPSGVLKTVYMDVHSNNPKDIEYTKYHRRLEEVLKNLEFDIAFHKEEGPLNSRDMGTATTLLAIKQPVAGITARQLLSMDMQDMEDQINRLLEKGFRPESPNSPMWGFEYRAD